MSDIIIKIFEDHVIHLVQRWFRMFDSTSAILKGIEHFDII